MTKQKKHKKLVFTIEYTVDPRDINIQEALDRLCETGHAEVIDVRIQEEKYD